MNDVRTAAQIREHYEIEVELANRLRTSSKNERKKLYSVVYNELFTRVTHHPMNARKENPQETQQYVSKRLRLLREYIHPQATYLEVGAGDCKLALEVAKQVKMAYAVEVSDEIAKTKQFPPNFQLIISDGTSIPVEPASINLAFSDQLMEHLHQDDALEQLANIYQSLAPDGRYVCFTPSAFSGPHDVSMHFDTVAKGLHMHEYTNAELVSLFKKAGFEKVRILAGIKGLNELPALPFILVEKFLGFLPRSINRKLAQTPIFKALGTGNLRIVGIKGTQAK